MYPEMHLKFKILGENVPFDLISNELEMEPTKTWKKGETVAQSNIKRKCDGWSYDIISNKAYHLDEQLKSILSLFLPKKETLIDLIEKFKLEIEIACVIYVTDTVPSITLDHKLLHNIVELKSDLDVDVILIAE